MTSRRARAIALTALAVTLGSSVAAQGVRRLLPNSIGDLNAAQLIEVKDEAGQVFLHGTLETTSNSVNETEREAELVSPTGESATGRVEIEIKRKNGAVDDGFEIEIERVPARVQYELFIDGKHVTSFVTTKHGKAALKLERKDPDPRPVSIH